MQRTHHDSTRRTVLSCTLAIASVIPAALHATETSHGEMRAAIRSADYPCTHVVAMESAGENAWSVQCNSGRFRVSRDPDGNYTVTQTE